jgi:hypothetical protein
VDHKISQRHRNSDSNSEIAKGDDWQENDSHSQNSGFKPAGNIPPVDSFDISEIHSPTEFRGRANQNFCEANRDERKPKVDEQSPAEKSGVIPYKLLPARSRFITHRFTIHSEGWHERASSYGLKH